MIPPLCIVVLSFQANPQVLCCLDGLIGTEILDGAGQRV
jgi:hypothetical protein